ncbi:conserved hypothetical protein [Culex quinquefasciatus]|uniref:Uncharacterized protein n=1 Tax=Culex quinquefasciatus TaxID=7176 RepID=B0WBC7_CULQU|nr:conserved hypothetical protein [Culex quinquefasciatus]|eukprot:XP_001846011.1 conserved hypothetical protein [Culex quinquefasciatus]
MAYPGALVPRRQVGEQVTMEMCSPIARHGPVPQMIEDVSCLDCPPKLGIDYVDEQDAERLLPGQPDEHSRDPVTASPTGPGHAGAAHQLGEPCPRVGSPSSRSQKAGSPRRTNDDASVLGQNNDQKAQNVGGRRNVDHRGRKSVTLGDEDGKVIGSSGLVKGEELEEGSRLSKEVELVERIDGEVAKENDVPVKRVRFEARGGFRPPAESMCAGSPIVVSSWLGLWGGSDCGGLCSIDDAGAFVRSVEV